MAGAPPAMWVMLSSGFVPEALGELDAFCRAVSKDLPSAAMESLRRPSRGSKPARLAGLPAVVGALFAADRAAGSGPSSRAAAPVAGGPLRGLPGLRAGRGLRPGRDRLQARHASCPSCPAPSAGGAGRAAPPARGNRARARHGRRARARLRRGHALRDGRRPAGACCRAAGSGSGGGGGLRQHAPGRRWGCTPPAALELLRAAAADAPLTRTVESLDPVRVALPGRV